MVMPGYSETYVPASINVRLIFALIISLILTPTLGNIIPPLPASVLVRRTDDCG